MVVQKQGLVILIFSFLPFFLSFFSDIAPQTLSRARLYLPQRCSPDSASFLFYRDRETMLAAAARTTMAATSSARATPSISAPSINRRSPLATLRNSPRRAPRTLKLAARAAAGGKAYICK